MTSRYQTEASVQQELEMAKQILASIMAPSNAKFTFPFLERIDAAAIGLYKYDEIVRCPMWLQKIEEKLEQGKYPGLCEFICDFRLILVNCFLYNGVDSKMGRLGEKLEILLEQKLQLLPIDLRHKTTMQACLGCGEAKQDDDGGPMRRRASLRHYGMGGSGSSGVGSQFCPVRALMEELEHHHTISSLGIASNNQVDASPSPSPSPFVTGSVLGLLYAEAGQQLPVTRANSRALLVARLTRWQRRAHEEELAAGWRDWWRGNGVARERLERLRACPQFLEAFQLLWLLEPYLNIGDVMSVASRLQHDICSAFRGDSALESASLFALGSSATASSAAQARQFSLTELELGLCGSPQTSICLAACVTALLNSSKERDTVSTALKALSAEKKSEAVNGVANTVAAVAAADVLPVDSDGEDGGDGPGDDDNGGEGEEKTRLLINRRVQNSHIETVKNLGAPPYEVWEGRLRNRLAQWYVEMSAEKRLEDPVRLERRSGVSAAFFRVCGAEKNPLEKKRFYELTIEEQAQILLSLASSVLLQNGNFGFGEHLRFSMDRSADWDSTRDSSLGKDVFRGLVYLTFPEMLRSEGPRIVQFALYPPTPSPEALTLATDFYTTSEASRVKELLDLNTIPLEYFLPGAVARLPKWVDPPVAKAVQAHLLGLMEAEIDTLSTRINSCGKKKTVPAALAKEIKKERGKMNALVGELAPFRGEAKAKTAASKKRKSTAKEKEKEKTAPTTPTPTTTVKAVDAVEGLQLAPFGFVKRFACGHVPASAVYARQAAMSKSLKAVESYASMAESTITTTNNNSEAGTPKPAKFFQEDGDDASVQMSVDGCQTPSTIPCVGRSPDSKLESTSFSSAQEQEPEKTGKREEQEEEEEEEVKSKPKESERNGFAGDTAAIAPPKQEKNEAPAEVKEEQEQEEEEDEAAATEDGDNEDEEEEEEGDEDEKERRRKSRSKKRRTDPVAAAKAEAEYKERARGISELISKATESELDAKQHRFATVVYDLETFNVFRSSLATRLATARRLLKELTSVSTGKMPEGGAEASSSSNPAASLRSVVEKFAEELGDELLKKVEADAELSAVLSGEPLKKEGEEKKKKGEDEEKSKPPVIEREVEAEAEETKGLKNPRKRRRTTFLTGRSRKAPRRSKADASASIAAAVSVEPEVEEAPVDESQARRAEIVRLHEEAVADLASLVEALDAMETEVAAAEEEREALERQCGLLLRKDIEARTPRSPEKPKPVPPRPVRQIATVPRPANFTPTITASHPSPPTSTVVTRTFVRPVTTNGTPVRLLPHPVARFGMPAPMRIPAPISPIPRAPTRPVRPPGAAPGRRIFRFHGTLFTEDGLPVRVGPDGTVVYMPIESVPLSHRQQAIAMIRQFRASSGGNPMPRM